MPNVNLASLLPVEIYLLSDWASVTPAFLSLFDMVIAAPFALNKNPVIQWRAKTLNPIVIPKQSPARA